MNGYIVPRTPYLQTEILSLEFSKEIANLYNIFPHSPLWNLLDSFLHHIFWVPPMCYTFLNLFFFLISPWIASPGRCFSINAPILHHSILRLSKTETYSFFSKYVSNTFPTPVTLKEYDARRQRCESCLHVVAHREGVFFYFPWSCCFSKSLKENWKPHL